MRGKWIFLVIFLLSLIFTGIASAAQWAKIYGNFGGFVAKSIQQTSDGGYIVAGFLKDGLFRDMWVLKLDAKGNVQWQKTYGGEIDDEAYTIQQTSDGGYIVAGYTRSFGSGYNDVWVLKLDANGNIQWQKTYGYGVNDYAKSIKQTSDGGYIVAGYTYSFGSNDVWVLKLDANGDIQWQKRYGGDWSDYAYSIQQTSDGGYIVAGHTESFGLVMGGGYAWVLKLDANGNVQWQKAYGGPGNDEAYSIQQTSDGGYIVAGWTSSFFSGDYNAWVLKLDANGNVQWQKAYGGKYWDSADSIQQTSDGGYIVAGWTQSFSYPSFRAWVLKLDANGNIPDCSIVGSFNATVKTTNATVANTSAKVINTNVTPGISNAVVKDPSVSQMQICYYESCTPPFTDIPCDFWAINEITWAKNRGITKGYPDGTYRPYEPVKRDAMAAFIVRALFGDNPTCQGGVPCESTQPYFKDVDQSHPFFRHIQKLYEAGITKGYPDGTYRPYENIRRDAMAAFLIRALGYGDNPICSGGVLCEKTQPYFMDVPPTHPFYKHIQKLKELGITRGCRQDPPMYCPDNYVTRDAMAVFLYRAFSSSISPPAEFKFYSPTIPENGTIPLKYVMPGAGGQNVSPPLKWEGIPSGTKSLVLLMYDRHPIANNWVHWIVINIPTSVTEFPEGASGRMITSPARELINTYGFRGYGGPQPPSGTGQHPYVFRLYALSVPEINLSSQPNYDEVIRAVQPYVIDYKEFVGYFGR